MSEHFGGSKVRVAPRLGASRMFSDMAREIAPESADLHQLAEVGGRHGLKVAN